MRNLNKFLIIPYLLWMIIFIIIPVLLLVYFSFIDINGHFSFTNYRQVFSMKYLKMMWILFLCDTYNNHYTNYKLSCSLFY